MIELYLCSYVLARTQNQIIHRSSICITYSRAANNHPLSITNFLNFFQPHPLNSSPPIIYYIESLISSQRIGLLQGGNQIETTCRSTRKSLKRELHMAICVHLKCLFDQSMFSIFNPIHSPTPPFINFPKLFSLPPPVLHRKRNAYCNELI